jgi:hypothetical protein
MKPVKDLEEYIALAPKRISNLNIDLEYDEYYGRYYYRSELWTSHWAI